VFVEDLVAGDHSLGECLRGDKLGEGVLFVVFERLGAPFIVPLLHLLIEVESLLRDDLLGVNHVHYVLFERP
jgi:hypothetical protein